MKSLDYYYSMFFCFIRKIRQMTGDFKTNGCFWWKNARYSTLTVLKHYWLLCVTIPCTYVFIPLFTIQLFRIEKVFVFPRACSIKVLSSLEVTMVTSNLTISLCYPDFQNPYYIQYNMTYIRFPLNGKFDFLRILLVNEISW